MSLPAGLLKNLAKLGFNTNKTLSPVRWSSTSATKTLFVRKLPWTCKPVDIHDLFSTYGPIHNIGYPTDEVGRYKGFAFVTLDSDKAELAVERLNFRPMEDKFIQVSIAEEKPKKFKASE